MLPQRVGILVFRTSGRMLGVRRIVVNEFLGSAVRQVWHHAELARWISIFCQVTYDSGRGKKGDSHTVKKHYRTSDYTLLEDGPDSRSWASASLPWMYINSFRRLGS
jgi:hypothetical protein